MDKIDMSVMISLETIRDVCTERNSGKLAAGNDVPNSNGG